VLVIDERECTMLVDLIESRIRDLHPTIRRSRVSECKEGLKEDLHVLERLLKRFETAATESSV